MSHYTKFLLTGKAYGVLSVSKVLKIYLPAIKSY